MTKFTNAPLPSLRLLVRALLKLNHKEHKLLKSWKFKEHLTLTLSRSAWSMQLIAEYKLIQSSDSKLNILVPSYFCNASLAPLREMKACLIFYPIMEDGKPDIEEIKNILSEKKIDILIGAHFFSNYIDFTELSLLAKKSNVWFVEDCAHLLDLPKQTEIKSDFQLFSPHKFLPIPDGAILSVNKRIFKNTNDLKEFEKMYRAYVKGQYSNFKAFAWLFKRIIQKLNFGIKLGIKDFYKDETIVNSKGFPKRGMTTFSKALLEEMNFKVYEETAKRRENAESWKEIILSRHPSARVVFSDLGFKSIYLLGIKFSCEADLKIALKWLNEKEYPICTWPDLPLEVLENKKYFKNSLELRNKCIFFHVHSSIDKKHIESSIIS